MEVGNTREEALIIKVLRNNASALSGHKNVHIGVRNAASLADEIIKQLQANGLLVEGTDLARCKSEVVPAMLQAGEGLSLVNGDAEIPAQEVANWIYSALDSRGLLSHPPH